MWEEGLIFTLIYLGVLFILPDKIRNTILSNGLLCAMIITGFLAGMYGILLYSSKAEGFYQATGSAACPASGCAANPSCCTADTPYCLVNEKRLPTGDIDQTVEFNIYGRYVRIYAPETGGDGHVLLSQVVVNNAAGTNIALTKTATATGTHPQATKNPSSVIDGNLTHRSWPNIWHSASNNRATDYWQVDLGSRDMITTVRVLVESGVNAVNAARTTGLRIVVLEALEDETEKKDITEKQEPDITEKVLQSDDKDQTVSFNTSGRYVRIYHANGVPYLTLTQVVINNAAGTNIALNGLVTATTTFPGAKPPTSLVDGTLTIGSWPNIWHNNSTDQETDHVQIDLGSNQMISSVRLIGTANYTMYPLRVLVVKETEIEDNTTEKLLPNANVDQTVSFNTSGRYVDVYASEMAKDGYMHLTQVIVNNATGTNIALNKPVIATSSMSGANPATILVNGTLSPGSWPNIWHNNIPTNRATERVRIDLGSNQMISSVRIIGRSDADSDRTTGLRIRVIATIAKVNAALPNVRTIINKNQGYPNGICTKMPTIIYPPGTTEDEQHFIGPMILQRLNVDSVLKIYRGVASHPSTFTSYGLTDSQSAAAAVEIRKRNLMAQRSRNDITDTAYYSAVNSLKQKTTMDGIGFNVSNELQTYMNANIINRPGGTYTDASGNIKVRLISDGGKENATRLILEILRPKTRDPSAQNSQETIPNANVNVPPPPNTGTWAQDAARNMPNVSGTVALPTNATTAQTTITVNMTPAQKEAAVRANNPRMIVITPDMPETEKRRLKNEALAAQNQNQGSSVPLTNAQFESIASSTTTGKGFSSPNTSYAAGGQGQWYMLKVSVPSSQASGKCIEYNGRLATRQQIQEAQTNGASYTTHGWYSGDFSKVAYPKSTGVQEIAAGTGNYEVNCYGPKPPPGTTDVAPWTDHAKTFPAGPTYVVGDWSQRIGGDGGVAVNADGTKKYPGAVLRTQEVYYVGGNQSLTKAQSTLLCQKLGGSLATEAQLAAAVQQKAKWCGKGWLSGPNDARSAATGCASTTITGATCFGVKPSANATGDNKANISSSNSGVNFNVYAEPFNKTMEDGTTTVTSVSWTQVAVDPGLDCRAGTRTLMCNKNGVNRPTCVPNSKNTCNASECTVANNQGGAQGLCSSQTIGSTFCPTGTYSSFCNNKRVCVPMRGDCNDAFPPPGEHMVEAPDDLDETRFRGYCNYIMKTTDELSKIKKAPLTIKAAWWADPNILYAYPAIHYVPDNLYNSLKTRGVDPGDGLLYCDQNPAGCKRACCYGGTPVYRSLHLVGMDTEYPGVRYATGDTILYGRTVSSHDAKYEDISRIANLLHKIATNQGIRFLSNRFNTSSYLDADYVCPGPQGVPCDQDDQCFSGKCANKKCGCTKAEDCKDSNVCNINTNRCKNNVHARCEANEDCVTGVCLSAVKKCGCASSSDCQSGDCVNNICRNYGKELCSRHLNGADCKSGTCLADTPPATNGDGFCASLAGESCKIKTDCKSFYFSSWQNGTTANPRDFCGTNKKCLTESLGTCLMDANCIPPYKCVDGLCKGVAGAGCDSYNHCISGMCEAMREDGIRICSSLAGESCNNNTECLSYHRHDYAGRGFCNSNKKCYTEPSGKCEMDANCIPPYKCVGGVCKGDMGAGCAYNGECKSDRCVGGSCGALAGESCNTDTNCVAHHNRDWAGINVATQPVTTTGFCSSNKKCYTEPLGRCQTDANCIPPYKCVGGICLGGQGATCARNSEINVYSRDANKCMNPFVCRTGAGRGDIYNTPLAKTLSFCF
jgi:hypothetical protein